MWIMNVIIMSFMAVIALTSLWRNNYSTKEERERIAEIWDRMAKNEEEANRLRNETNKLFERMLEIQENKTTRIRKKSEPVGHSPLGNAFEFCKSKTSEGGE